VTGAELLALCNDALRAAGEEEAEIFLQWQSRGVARFSMGELREHMDLTETDAAVRVARGRRVAETATTSFEHGDLVAAIRQAAATAPVLPETDGFEGFAGASEELTSPPRFAESTARATAEERVETLLPAFAAVKSAGLISAGILSTSQSATAVATTRGAARQHRGTAASYRVWALETAGAGGASGYGGHMHREFPELRVGAETERAIRWARLGREPIDIDAGDYDVVLEPVAVAELLEWLAMIAFTAPDMERGVSPLFGRLGERITGESISIHENPLDDGPLAFAAPFDREGVSRRHVSLIERGVAKGVLYDRAHAARAGVASTGSAQRQCVLTGAVGASALQMAGGTANSVDELVAGVRRGLYVCRLHYVNGLLDPRRAMMTGISRDGCFLIEDGRITRPVKNVRFTDSFLEGLARCDGMTRERQAIPSQWSPESTGGAIVAPAVRIRAFHFDGKRQ
jgi:PmbA protein